jgi:hypothetical protein
MGTQDPAQHRYLSRSKSYNDEQRGLKNGNHADTYGTKKEVEGYQDLHDWGGDYKYLW